MTSQWQTPAEVGSACIAHNVIGRRPVPPGIDFLQHAETQSTCILCTQKHECKKPAKRLSANECSMIARYALNHDKLCSMRDGQTFIRQSICTILLCSYHAYDVQCTEVPTRASADNSLCQWDYTICTACPAIRNTNNQSSITFHNFLQVALAVTVGLQHNTGATCIA
ncbi:hypothetical protein ABBQ32_010117 [Trebouxia sp. C0010 RCD-2024]